MTQVAIDKTKADYDPNQKSKRSISKGSKGMTEAQKNLATIPKGTVDEDRIMYWLWGKINSTYMKYVSKYSLLDYLEMHPETIHAFGFHPKEYRRVILSMITERHDMLTFDEFDVG